MLRLNHLFLYIVVGVIAWVSPVLALDVNLHDNSAQVYFSPNGGAQNAIVRSIGKARETIYIQAYSFTSAPIAQALVEAYNRGVKVNAILDKSQRTERYSGATFLANSGVSVFIDDAHAIAHNKVIILDGKTIITGSFNFTKAAEEKNAENILIIDSVELSNVYMNNWDMHRKHSTEYTRK